MAYARWLQFRLYAISWVIGERSSIGHVYITWSTERGVVVTRS